MGEDVIYMSPREGLLATLGILEEFNKNVEGFGKSIVVSDMGNEINNWLQVVWGCRGNFDMGICPRRAYGEDGEICAGSSETQGEVTWVGGCLWAKFQGW